MNNRSSNQKYLDWIISEINAVLCEADLTKNAFTPLSINEQFDCKGKNAKTERLLVASEIYKYTKGEKWRLLDLEKMIDKYGFDTFQKKEISEDIKFLIEEEELINSDVLKMCLLLTGIKKDIIDDARYALQKRYFHTGNPNKLWSSIGYYDIKKKKIVISTGANTNEGKYRFALSDIIETACHELGHHIYLSLMSKRFKVPKGTIAMIRALMKGAKTSKNPIENKQWKKFYRKDYERDWIKNEAMHIVPMKSYVRYGIENELFAQIISGKTTLSTEKRAEIIRLINLAEKKR